MHSTPSRRPLVARILTALILGVTLLAAPGAAGAEEGSIAAADPQDKIRPELGQRLADKGEATFWIRYEQADLSAAQRIADWDSRGKAVYEALTDAAEASQKESVALLESAGVRYTSYFATNAVRVEAGDADLALRVAELRDVQALYPSFEVVQEEPAKGRDVREVDAVEWGIANINADDVWSQFGTQGEGLVVANIDSGVQYDHPALVGQYRGNNGDGTFDHDYNWFNAAGSCTTAPCDTNGHGTHTMGTMVGDDAGANQVGVAPGATWIAANGCCPSDAALIASGEWMLAPADLSGNNPDTSKRPHIVNNSWGTQTPSNSPFMEDVTQAWTAAGIFGMFSNGNSGPACATSGSPGSRIVNYSSGAYDINNAIASFSARGAGQDGEIKPNLAAPGVNVRSSLPGNAYGNFSGTSMASPHVAGTVALLWSAAPSLLGQVEETRALLDGSSVDVDSTTCGGTADDNNVFGEGRLDALALLDAAPVGDTGTIAGTVTDSATDEPIDGATIEITGAADRSLTTGADGSYSVSLPAGDYSVAAAAFGSIGESTDVTLVADETVTADFALDGAASATVTGFVNDGSGHDWPLYAEVAVDGPAPDVWTDPISGRYTMTVPSNATYSLTVTPAYPGYLPVTEDVEVGSGNVRRDFDVLVDDSTCVAPGYQFFTEGVTESFDATTAPPGWTVVDNVGNGQVWRFDNPDGRANLTGGSGNFAIMDSDFYGSSGKQDTSLVSPVVDMSGLTAPVVGFKQDYNNLGDVADVDVSIDGGATWENVLNQTTDVRGPREDVIQLPMAAGESAVQVRFHQYEADFDWWWEVDDVFVGNRTCDPSIEGGLVAGLVRDGNTGEGIVGATVTSDTAPDESATTVATPDDDALDDGFYWMFSTQTGEQPFTASANQYQSQTRVLDVDLDDTTRGNFTLSAGSLTVTPSELSATMTLGARTATRTFTVTNDGSATANVEFSERPGGFTMLGADGSRTKTSSTADDEGAALQRLDVPTSFAATGASDSKGSDVIRPNAAPWTDIADYPTTVMDNRVVYVHGVAYSIAGGTGSASQALVYAYDPATLAWTEKASLPAARNAVSAGVVDGQIVVTGGWAAAGPSTSTWAYDPAADTWTAKAAAPVARAAAGQAVVDGKLYIVGGCTTSACTPMANSVAAYDLATDTWETLASYPESVAFASCGGIDGALYCTGGNGGAAGTAASHEYDPGADAWSPIDAAPVATWASAYTVANGTLVVNGGVQGTVVTNRTFAYDPAAESWIDMPNSNTARYRGGAACGLYKIGGASGGFVATVDTEMLPGFEDCGASAADVEWLSINKTSATLEPGESVQVRVTMDANVAQPGTYTASVGITDDVPGSVEPVGVTMTINPPRAWGKLAGTVSGRSCAGAVAPLPAATLQVDSWAGSWSFETAGDGSYAYWFNTGANPLTLIAAKDGYAPQTRKVRLYRGETVTADFTLRRSGC